MENVLVEKNGKKICTAIRAKRRRKGGLLRKIAPVVTLSVFYLVTFGIIFIGAPLVGMLIRANF